MAPAPMALIQSGSSSSCVGSGALDSGGFIALTHSGSSPWSMGSAGFDSSSPKADLLSSNAPVAAPHPAARRKSGSSSSGWTEGCSDSAAAPNIGAAVDSIPPKGGGSGEADEPKTDSGAD